MEDRDWTWWVAAIGAGGFLLFGVFALAAPQAFFDHLATFEPYNRHFIHDIGAFQIGMGAVLAFALFPQRFDGLTAALLGTGVGASAHVLSHLMDTDLGGTPATDIPTFTLLAVALMAAGVQRARVSRSS